MLPKLLAAVATLGMLWALLRRFESANLYHPDPVLTAHPGSYGLAYEDLALKTEDGETLHGWFVAAPKPSDSAVVIFHGNAGNVSARVLKLKLFHEMGRSVLLFDYRGYGRSTGRPSERGVYLDAMAALGELERRGFPPARAAYYGESLGCAVAVEAARRRAPAALILDSPFTSTIDMAKLIFPWLPARRLVRDRYDNAAKVPGLRCPLLIMHSPQDDVVPFAMGRRLFESAAEPKEFFQSRGDHNEGFMDTPGFAPAMANFLRRHLR